MFQFLVQLIAGVIIIAPIIWLVGRALAGKEKAKFTSALLIVVLGTFADALIGAVYASASAVVGVYAVWPTMYLIMFIVWFAVIKHFFNCGWLRALAIAIIAGIILIIVVIILGIILLGILGPLSDCTRATIHL